MGLTRGAQAATAAFDPAGPSSVVVFSAGSNGGNSVPEPATLALLAAAVAGIGWRRRVRMRSGMTRQRLFLVDGVINLVLAAGLVAYPTGVVEWLGFPASDSAFYPMVLGAVLFGIGVSLACGWLGLRGAIAINLCGAAILVGWLLFGDLALPARGIGLLWLLVAALVGLSACEWRAARGSSRLNDGA